MRRIKISFTLMLAVAFFAAFASSQTAITTPKEHIGFNIGDDYHLANYSQLSSYWKKLEQESDRLALAEIGRTAEGRSMLMAIITSPENHQNLECYKQIAGRLALAEGLDEKEARALASEGKAVVWIDGGLHGTEVLGAQQLIELVYQMVSRDDPETLRILNDVILLAVCSNPDGMELVSDWYMRQKDPMKRSTRDLPRLYQKYVGHDNNRDFYMSTQPETEAINRVLYREWFPQIAYNHHQTGPSGTVLFAPPFRDPFNYCFDPLIPVGIELVGAAMHSRFVAENKPGATMRTGAGYSIWWNGGLRTTVYFHNMIGILTETIGHPTPMAIPFLPERQLPKGNLPFPIAPQEWHFRQSVEYSITADRAVLDVASKHREDFLMNIYRMGKKSIERGNQDSWTICPSRIEGVEKAIKKDKAKMVGSGRSRGYPMKYYEMLRQPEDRDPRGFIIPADQPDFLTATKFVNTLIKNGITVHQAKDMFSVSGKTYPAGSYVVLAAQAFRPHLLSMFEPQDYPNNLAYPGGPPIPTYDNAGWTLAFQMGIEFDRILEGFSGPFEKILDMIGPPPGRVLDADKSAGFLLSHRANDAFIAVNRLLKDGEKIYWLREPVKIGEKAYPPGTFFIPIQDSTAAKLNSLASGLGLTFKGIQNKPQGEAFVLHPVRIGLWDRYGGSMTSGWVRWLLEQFEFQFDVVYPQRLDKGGLKDDFDVLIFVSGAIPGPQTEQRMRFWSSQPPKPEDIPAEYHERLGRITREKTIPQLLEFVKSGGAVLTIGSSTSLGYHAGLPIENALVEKQQDGKKRPLPREKYFIPGSILQTRVDNTNPLAHGIPEHVDVTYNWSPVFRLKPEAALKGVQPVAWFDGDAPLRSGWAWGQHYLEGGVAVLAAEIGRGKLFLFGPEITFRGQPHGTFKFLFNGIYYGSADAITME